MNASTQGLIPAPRPALEELPPVPFRLPWPRERAACRSAIGDALLLQYPEVAKALAEGRRSEETGRCFAASAAAATEEDSR